MSTRSVLLVKSVFDWGDARDESHVARFYRHLDGYPEGFGMDICSALAEASMNPLLNNRNWAQHFLAALLSKRMDVEIEPPDGKLAFCHTDIEYAYVVTGTQDYTGGKESAKSLENVTVDVYRVRWGVDVGDMYEGLRDPIFHGGWRDMARWLCSETSWGDFISSPNFKPRDAAVWDAVRGAALGDGGKGA